MKKASGKLLKTLRVIVITISIIVVALLISYMIYTAQMLEAAL